MEHREAEESTAKPAGGADWRWLEQSAAGDEAAFARLVAMHQDRLVGLCQRLLGAREPALEAAQEVFLKLYRQAGRLERRGQLYTWLYRVATNHCLNRLRRRRLVRFLPLVGGRDDDESRPLEPEDAAPGPERRLEARRRWSAARRAIAALPPSQRAVLVLARFEGLSYRQIARTLGITEAAVESRLFRAMRSLRRAQEDAAAGVSEGG